MFERIKKPYCAHTPFKTSKKSLGISLSYAFSVIISTCLSSLSVVAKI